MDSALLFPGQGSLDAGSRELVVEVWPELLERCAALVGDDPFERAAESTRYAQPATVCASLAGWRRLGEPEVQAAAGHSLGELSALAAAGALSVDDALALVAERGRLMERAAGASPGGMVAVLRATPEQAADLAAATGATLANDNAPGQLVLSGPDEALERMAAAARERGLRTMALDVAGAFHSPAMAPAVEPFRAALEAVPLAEPRFPVLSCLTAAPLRDVRGQLAAALTAPVHWRQTVIALAARGIDRFVDVGPGRVLDRLVRRTLPHAEVVSAEELHGVGA